MLLCSRVVVIRRKKIESMLRLLCVLLSALSASVLATKKSCAPLHIPRGKCWTDSKHRIETFPHSPNATFCCDRCQALQGCQVLAMASCPLCYTSSHALARNDVFIDTTYQIRFGCTGCPTQLRSNFRAICTAHLKTPFHAPVITTTPLDGLRLLYHLRPDLHPHLRLTSRHIPRLLVPKT